METKKLNARDQMLHIINVVWTSRQMEQLKGCEKMLDAYIKENGNENIGVTFIQVELSRQKRLIGMFAKMGNVQDALKKENAEKKEQSVKKVNETKVKPITKESERLINTPRAKEIEREQSKIMNEKFKNNIN